MWSETTLSLLTQARKNIELTIHIKHRAENQLCLTIVEIMVERLIHTIFESSSSPDEALQSALILSGLTDPIVGSITLEQTVEESPKMDLRESSKSKEPLPIKGLRGLGKKSKVEDEITETEEEKPSNSKHPTKGLRGLGKKSKVEAEIVESESPFIEDESSIEDNDILGLISKYST